jgi:predicted Zn-dependent protease
MYEPILNATLNRRQVLWLMGACSAAPIITGCAVNPVTGEKQLMLMTEQEEIQIDQSQSPHQFSNDYGIVQDDALNRYIAAVGKPLAGLSHRPAMPFGFQAVNANYINAYAFPGGSIAVTRGILVNLNNEAELAGLLGHEIGHVCARHTAQRMTKNRLLGLAMIGAEVALGQSEASDTVKTIALQATQIGGAAMLAHYSREDERQADALGMEYMVKANYNPHGMVGLMNLLRNMSNHQPSALERMFSTHPMSGERYATAAQVAETQYAATRSAPLNKERFLDNTAKLRKIKSAINHFEKAERLIAKQQHEAARQALDAGLRQAPNDYVGLVLKGKLALSREQSAAALNAFRSASRVYPREGQAQHLMGVALLAQGKPDQALAQFQRYDSLLPGNPTTGFMKGIALEQTQDKARAAEHFKVYLQQVRQGDQAKYAQQRLAEWGYLQNAQ